VVISIIAMLISLLLPALSKARESSRRVVCISNMRNLYIGFYQYTEDHSGNAPPWLIGAPTFGAYSQYENWVNILVGKSAWGARRSSEYIPGYTRHLGNRDGDRSVFACPSTDELLGPSWTAYGANATMFNYVNTSGTSTPSTWLNLGLLEGKKPISDVVMLYCAAYAYLGGSPRHAFGDWDTTPRYFDVHGDGYPILWFDGHANFMGKDTNIMNASEVELTLHHWTWN
jgi:prepilin-type processing-associated H-X9-DG protein